MNLFEDRLKRASGVLVIKNGHIVNPPTNFEGEGHIFIKDGKIEKIMEGQKWEEAHDKLLSELSADKDDFEVIDAEGKWVVPGLIDLHVHLREPGYEYKEDIRSGSAAAAAGGFTTVCAMPNTKPCADNEEVINLIYEKAKEAGMVRVLQLGAMSIGQQGKEPARIKEMAEAGICGISEDGRTLMDSSLMLKTMRMAKELGLSTFSHTEDENLAGTPIGEELIVARDIMLAKECDAELHLCHISTEGSLEIIRRAKADGLKVTAETAPHYFIFTKDDVKGDGHKKMNPPLREEKDRLAVIRALEDGTLDAIATDHAPHHSDEKLVEFEKAAYGIIGLEASFPVSYTSLVKGGILKPIELIEKLSSKPAQILGISDKIGSIDQGHTADLTILDVTNEYEITKEHFKSKSKNSPFIGMKVYGKVKYTIVAGNVMKV